MRKTAKGSPKLACCYVRVSKEDQKLGPDAQRAAVEAWSVREGVTIVGWYLDLDVCSVTPLDEREGLMAAIAGLREHGAGVLVVGKRDRIARDPALTAGVEHLARAAGAVVRSAAGEGNGDSPADEFMRGVIDSASRYERALIRARTKAALAVIRARGHKTGGSVPYGFTTELVDVPGQVKKAKRLVEVPAEQAVIARARQLAAESMGPSAVARALTAEGHASRNGEAFKPMQVARMVADPFDAEGVAA